MIVATKTSVRWHVWNVSASATPAWPTADVQCLLCWRLYKKHSDTVFFQSNIHVSFGAVSVRGGVVEVLREDGCGGIRRRDDDANHNGFHGAVLRVCNGEFAFSLSEYRTHSRVNTSGVVDRRAYKEREKEESVVDRRAYKGREKEESDTA